MNTYRDEHKYTYSIRPKMARPEGRVGAKDEGWGWGGGGGERKVEAIIFSFPYI